MSTLWHMWGYVRWPLAVLVVAFVAFVGWRVVVLNHKEATAVAVAAIHADKLTWEDVSNLPPEPDAAANNATLAGIDANHNGIRDDVERAIFAKYKATKAAVAMLQYAKELQMEFTRVTDSETLVAVLQEEHKGSLCVGDDDEKTNYVLGLVFNTESRKQWRETIAEKYMTSYTLLNTEGCTLSF